MSLNINQIKARLNSFSSTNSKSILIWKPNPGKQVVRIVPYKYSPEFPFIELKFHYGLNNKTYLSPDSFNRPDPIVEFSNKLKSSGTKDEWRFGKKIEPKMRTFVPVIVRGEEAMGVRFWGFGKNVYQELLSVIADPDYGNITDPSSGRDIVVEFKTAEETGKQYPETTVRVKPNPSPAVDPSNKELIAKIANQTNILDLFPEPTYADLKAAMEQWLSSKDGGEGAESTPSDSDASPLVEEEIPTEAVVDKPQPSPSKVAAKSNSEDVTKVFDDLFNSK